MVGGIIVGAVAIATLLSFLGSDKDDNFVDTDVVQSFLRDYSSCKTERLLKTSITKTINNNIIPTCRGFKIGKSGSIKNRLAQHKSKSDGYKYKKMYLICRSKTEDDIKSLEKYYNNYYIGHKKNDNKKEGSAGVCKDNDNYYYLYVVAR